MAYIRRLERFGGQNNFDPDLYHMTFKLKCIKINLNRRLSI